MTMISQNRWTARPGLARTIRAASLILPLGLSFIAALITQRRLDEWFPAAPWLVGAAVSLAVAMIVLFLGERMARRLLPMTMLLKLALLFPDQVPSRFKIALRSTSPRRLAKQLESGNLEDATAAERVLSLVTTLSAHDRRTRGHCERVRAVSMILADEMGIIGTDRDKLEWAALLHDVGKMTVAPAILNKRGAPTDAEWNELRKHPAAGAPLAGELAEWMGDWVHAIDQHHEKFDGSGYPEGLRGKHIATGARIVAVADAFEVMTAVRSYKSAMSIAEARAELAKCSGSHFDPVVIRSFATLSVARLHKSLGPTSWVASLPFRGVAVRVVRGASAVAGGSAPSALVGVTALVAMSMTAVAAADVVDDRLDNQDQSALVAESFAEPQDATPTPTAEPQPSPDSEADVVPSPSPTGERVENPGAAPEPVATPVGQPTTEPGAQTSVTTDENPSAATTTEDEPGQTEPIPTGPIPAGPDFGGLDLSGLNLSGVVPELDVPAVPAPLDLDTAIPTVPTLVPEPVTEVVTDVIDTVDQTVTEVIDTTEQIVTDVIDTVDQTVTEVIDTVDQTVTEVIDTTEQAVTEVIDTVDQTVTEVIDTTEQAVTEVVDTVDQTVVGVGDGAAAIIDDVVVPVPAVTVSPVPVPVVPVPVVSVVPLPIPVEVETSVPQSSVSQAPQPTATAAPSVSVPAPDPVAEVVEAVEEIELLPPVGGLGGF